MVVEIIIAFLIPVLCALAITPWVITLAKRIGAVDDPGGRKIHKKVTPRLGGLVVFCSVFISVVTIYLLFPTLLDGVLNNYQSTYLTVGGIAIIFFLGFWDDLKSLSPGVKFGIQFIAAALIYFAGFKISNVTNPVGDGMLNVEMIDFPLTMLWIVGITNAFNLIDGLDGLASGVATIACVSIFTISAIEGEIWTAVLTLVLAGALVGFLRYNFSPAKIFLGDSGSLFIGFSLALLSIHSTTKITTGFALFFPMLVLGLPITDTIVSMIRRFLSHYLPGRSEKNSTIARKLSDMFRPDKSHIHHQLLSLGLTHRNTVLVLYFVSAFFAAGAFTLAQVNNLERSISIGLLVGFLLFLGIKKLRYREISILNNGMVKSIYERFILNKTTFISLLDLCFIAIAYSLSYLLIKSINPASIALLNFNQVLIVLLSVQLFAFWLTGLYRETIRQMGIGNALGITRSVGYAIISTALVLLILDILPLISVFQLMIVDFYFLLSCVLGFRIAYQALNYWFNRDKDTGENVLIYGANKHGIIILHKLNSTADKNYKVLGFLDDDPELEGKMLNGYPVLGNHWRLARALTYTRVDCIFICDQVIKTEDFNRLQTLARNNEINIKRMYVEMKNISFNSGKEELSPPTKVEHVETG